VISHKIAINDSIMCTVISPTRRRSVQIYEFVLEGKPMEFVSSYSHLGHLITDRLDDSCDISQRRNDFVGQVNNVLSYFQNQCSDVQESCAIAKMTAQCALYT